MKWMDRERSFWVIGGDLRQRALARLLREDGHTVHIAGLEGEGLEPEPLGPGLALAHCVILPLPVAVGESFVHTPLSAARLPLAQVLDCLRPGQLVCGGMISPAVAAEMTRRGLRRCGSLPPAISRRTYPSWNPCGMIQTAPLSRALLNMSLPTAPRRLRATAGRSRRKTTVFVILQTCERAGAGHYAIYK